MEKKKVDLEERRKQVLDNLIGMPKLLNFSQIKKLEDQIFANCCPNRRPGYASFELRAQIFEFENSSIWF